MKKQIFRALSLGLVMAFVLTACSKKPSNALAKVGNEYITAEDVNDFYNDYLTQNAMSLGEGQFDESTEEGKTNAQDLRAQVLDSLIYEKVVIQVAKDKKIEVKDDEIEEAYKSAIQQSGGEEGLEEYLKSAGITKEDFEKKYKESIKVQTYMSKLNDKLKEEYKMTDKDVTKELEKEKENYFPVYNADHILYSTMNDDNTPNTDEAKKAAVKAEAQAALDSIKTSDDFQKKFDEINVEKDAAAEGTIAPKTTSDTAIVAENLDNFTKDTMVKEFTDAVTAMKAGEISTALVETDFGYHIIRLDSVIEDVDKADKEYLTNIKSEVESNAIDSKINEYLDKQKEKMKVVYYNAEGKEVKDSKEAVKSFDFSKLNDSKKEATTDSTTATDGTTGTTDSTTTTEK